MIWQSRPQHLAASEVKSMSVLTPPMSSPASLKRSYADTGLDGRVRDETTPTPSGATQVPVSSQACSRSPSSVDLPMSTSSTAFNTSIAAIPDSATALAEIPNKRPKLTFAENQDKQMERQLKEQQRVEEKTKKEEEKAKKEEEKARRNEEKRVKEAEKEDRKKSKEGQAKAREAEKQRKLEEKQKAEEEKNKKARVCLYTGFERVMCVMLTFLQSQLRLNAFFVPPSIPNGTPSASPTGDISSPLSSRRNSIAEIHATDAPRERARSVSATPRKACPSDYERQFPPFFLQSHTVLAPYSRFSRDEKGLKYARTKIDEGLGQGNGTARSFDAYDLLHLPSKSSQRSDGIYAVKDIFAIHTVKDIMAKIHGSVRNPIDLTESQFSRVTQKPTDLLKNIPMKYLKFDEDYRPPYTGTFTKSLDRRAVSRLCRKPFSRELPNTNYDYDSEAEWEEPGEGEDLNSEGEEEVGEDDEENDMEGFLDDENDALKRGPLLGDLKPTCSGICWESLGNEDYQLANLDVLDPSLCKLDILMGKSLIPVPVPTLTNIENPQLPIDPYSTSYWKPITSITSINTPHLHGMLMEPPRIPLNPINRQNTLLVPSATTAGTKIAGSNTHTSMKPATGPKRLIPSELWQEFKTAVDGNELTKLGLLEVLKKQ